MMGGDVFGLGEPKGPAIAALTVLLYTFCILFAVNSAIHSYLIVRYSEGDKVAMQVGVYYASNALGRLVGTILSGVLYTYAGSTVVVRFGVCLFASVGFAAISSAVDVFLHEDKPGASWWSPFNRCLCSGPPGGGGGACEEKSEVVDIETACAQGPALAILTDSDKKNNAPT